MLKLSKYSVHERVYRAMSKHVITEIIRESFKYTKLRKKCCFVSDYFLSYGLFFLDEQSLAMQHFVGIYQDALQVFSIEELRYVIYE